MYLVTQGISINQTHAVIEFSIFFSLFYECTIVVILNSVPNIQLTQKSHLNDLYN